MDWIRGHTLGRGSTATVSIAEFCSSGDVFAVKSAELCHSEPLKREQGILSTLNSPQIVAYRGCDVTLENGALLYNLFMEYAPHGTLADEARRYKGGMPEPLVGLYTRQILHGVKYLHSKGIVHCDVKGQNVLVTEQGAKIADFGCARRVEDSCGGVIAGTPAFMAPEVARGEDQGFPADVWALGCTVLEMITGEAPWHGVNDPVTALYRIGFSGDIPEIPSYLSEEGKDFLSKCFKRDASQRWTVEQLLGHEFVRASSSNSMLSVKFKIVLDRCDSDTPNSVLDRGIWESLETEQNQKRACCSWNCTSARDRIRELCGEDTMIFAAEPNQESDHGWITVRTLNELEGYCNRLEFTAPEDNEKAEAFEFGIISIPSLKQSLILLDESDVIFMRIEFSRYNANICNYYFNTNHCCNNAKSLYGCPCRNLVSQYKFDSLLLKFLALFSVFTLIFPNKEINSNNFIN